MLMTIAIYDDTPIRLDLWSFEIQTYPQIPFKRSVDQANASTSLCPTAV
jgi:hypothetical protein